MLTVATPVAPGPLAGLTLPGGVPADDDGGLAFIQALDQATSEARPDDALQPQLLPALADTAMQPPLAEARPGAAPRAGGSPKVDKAQPLTEAQAETAFVSTASAPDEAPPTSEVHRDEPAPEHDEAPAAELLAWVASLPLPPPVPPIAPNQTQAPHAAAQPEAAIVVDASAVAVAVAAPAATSTRPAPIEAAAREHGAPPASARRADAPGTRDVLPAVTESGTPRIEAGGWLQTLPAQHEGIRAPAQAGNDSLPPLPATPGSLASPLPRPTDSSAPAQAEVRAEVGSKEFAPALGSQLSVMVRDGIEHAQLKLNPAEMGPIEVRISIDGSQAQVDFSAAQAHTRQALQDAVPALATALRESGLTLTGGGVFEQPRDSRGDAPAQPNSAGRTAADLAGDEPLPPSAAPRMSRARGVLDLYA